MNSFLGFFVGILQTVALMMGFSHAPAADNPPPSPQQVVDQYGTLPHGISTNGSQSGFSVTPVSGPVPLVVTFNFSDAPAGYFSNIDYGDGQYATDFYLTGNAVNHTYKEKGSYTARLLKIKNACYREQRDDQKPYPPCTQPNPKWQTDGVEVKRVTITVGEEQSDNNVPGMSKYTDSDFGFSFWYPNNWQVDSSIQGKDLEDCASKKAFSVHGSAASDGVTVEEYYCPNRTITLRGLGASPVGMDFEYYFDANAHTWMEKDLSPPPNGSPPSNGPTDISSNTMGGLHIFAGAARFGADIVIPLSAKNFLLVTRNDATGDLDERILAKTIVATDPSVATPVSTQGQIATIEAEKSAYRPDQSITIDKSSLTALPGKPIIRGTAKGLQTIGIRVADMQGGYIFGSGRVAVDAAGNWQVSIENDWQAELSPGSGTQLPPGQYIVYAASDVNDTQAAADSGVLTVTAQ